MKKDSSKIIAIIPARGGSKRIPRKNIKKFLGRPIIYYPIKAALESGLFDEVMVSTDDQEIAKIAKKFGAKVPFLRSAKNSSDKATTDAVIEEVIHKYQKCGQKFDVVCCIYPTAAFVTAKKLKSAQDLLKKSGADVVIPVVRHSNPIQRALKISNGKLKMFWPKNYYVRSQDLEPAYYDCGQFYFMKTEAILEQKKVYADSAVALEIPEVEAQDIDNETDWQLAELKYKLFKR